MLHVVAHSSPVFINFSKLSVTAPFGLQQQVDVSQSVQASHGIAGKAQV